ncbi:MAG: helix-hairpin-helix domain-containing protein [Flavobacteriales bacterium]|nr:MAG: helix-hairpin-helix domain-containing protein [Flavobacteriales bacterium]
MALLFGAMALRAQDDISPELRDLIEQRIATIAEQLGDESDVDLSSLADQLTERLSDPINLNRTDAEELGSLHLLTDIQINAILAHIIHFGKYISIYELQTVDGLDNATLEIMRPFVTVSGEGSSRTSLKEMLANGKSEFLFRTQINIEQRKGFLGGGDPFNSPYRDPDGDPLPDVDDPHVLDSLRANNKVYLGSPWKAYARYRFKYRRNLDFGITAEKDEGEEFFKGSQKQGFDFYSAHLFLRNIGPIKAVAIGDYQAQFGQGLVFSSGLSFARKSAYTMNISKNAPGLSPYASVNENQFLRGAGATMGFGKHLEGTAFISKKKYDANVQTSTDTSSTGFSDEQSTFSSFLEDGYHRTNTELGKKNALEEFIYGGHLEYKRTGWSLGATAAQVNFDNTLVKSSTQPYNQYEFQGNSNTTYGFDWNAVSRNVTWFGEGARSSNGGMAGVTGLLVALDKRLSLAMLYRDLQRDFQGLYSSAFAESSNPWNERGLYAEHRAEAQPEVGFQCLLRPVHLPVAPLPDQRPQQRIRGLGPIDVDAQQGRTGLREGPHPDETAQYHGKRQRHTPISGHQTEQLPLQRQLSRKPGRHLAHAHRKRGLSARIKPCGPRLPDLSGHHPPPQEGPGRVHRKDRLVLHGQL